MKSTRRQAIAAIAALLAAPPVMAQSRGRAFKRLGFLQRGVSPEQVLASVRESTLARHLAARGWTEGSTLEYACRTVGEDPAEWEPAARELVAMQPDAINVWAWFLAKALTKATQSIPIIAMVGDPLSTGLAKSIREPGGNVTGFSQAFDLVTQKHVDLLRQVLPAVATIHYLHDSTPEPFVRDAVHGAGLTLRVWKSLPDLSAALGARRETRSALMVPTWVPGGNYKRPADGYADAAATALRHHLPSVSVNQPFVRAGGLMSFVMSYHGDLNERLASLVDKVFRGENPATIPFELPTVSRFAVNRKTAEALGIALPKEWLIQADLIVDK